MPGLDEFIRRLRAVPASTAALRAERKRISKEIGGHIELSEPGR